jgi:hypothetical protein
MSNVVDRIADYIHDKTVRPETKLVNRLLEEGIFKSTDIKNYIDPEANKPYVISGWFKVDCIVSSYALHFNRPLLENEYGHYWGRLTKDSFNNDSNYIPVLYDGVLQKYAMDIVNAIRAKQKYFTLPSGESVNLTTDLLCAYKGLFHGPNINWTVLR